MTLPCHFDAAAVEKLFSQHWISALWAKQLNLKLRIFFSFGSVVRQF
jgi:hypothetical protein